MTKLFSLLRSEFAASITLIIAAAVAAYAKYIPQIGYINDDWYLMYAAKVGGAGYFSSLFSFDRPLRAFLFSPLYQLFGENPLLYNLSALMLRVLSAFLLLWILRMVWPKQRNATLSMTLIYLLYPGFLSQLNGIDYQPVFFSLVAAMLSLALSILAFYEQRKLRRRILIAAAIALGWVYVGLVEYEVAFEFLRIAIIFTLIRREKKSWQQNLALSLKAWWPYALIPIAFVIWNLFLFESQRQATSLGSQFAIWFSAPLQTSLSWLANLFVNTVNVLFSAWTVPLYQISSQVSAQILLLGVGLGLLIAILYLAYSNRFSGHDTSQNTSNWRAEAFYLGLSVAVIGIIPIIVANRQIIFPGLSRYSLVSSFGVAMLAVASLYHFSAPQLRKFFTVILIVLAISTQNSFSALKAQETASMRDFWWQTTWRIPQLATNTTLIVNYSGLSLAEEYFVWGPANLIYYPYNLSTRDYLQPGIYAALPNNITVQKVLSSVRQEYDNRRTIRTYANYRNILILSQPSPQSCVQVIDGAQPQLSSRESAEIISIASHSATDNILVNDPIKHPPEAVFGPEPTHSWCYFYQSAALARQNEDWPLVLEMGDQAIDQGLAAQDPIEWLPFLEAYAIDGQSQRLQEIATQIGEEPFVRLQACNLLSAIPTLDSDVLEQAEALFCLAES